MAEKADIPVFFILGRERSGTTLLQTLLNAHPQIYVPPESTFIRYLYRKYYRQTKWSSQQIDRFWKDLLTEPYMQLWPIDKELLRTELQAIEKPNFAKLCKVILAHSQKENTRLVGDKNPSYTRFASQLVHLFPNARFIRIVRDPRAQVNSMLQVNFEKKIISSLAVRWAYLNHPDRYQKVPAEQLLLLKYEDLIANPEATLQKICHFLEIPFDSEMLEKREESVKQQKYDIDHHQSLSGGIHTDRNQEWENSLSKKQIQLIETITKDVAGELGYESTLPPASFGQRIASLPGYLYGRLYFPFLRILESLPLSWRRGIFKSLILPNFKYWQEGHRKHADGQAAK